LKIMTNMLLGSISTLLCATQSAPALAEEPVIGVHLVVVDMGTVRNTRGLLRCSRSVGKLSLAPVAPSCFPLLRRGG
jgi:hypothetical protein